MNLEQQFFIKILSDNINKIETSIPSFAIDWEYLCRIAKEQELECIVFYQCKDMLPKQYYDKLERVYTLTGYYYLNRLAHENIVADEFSRLNIKYSFVKGTTIAEYYSLPALRSMGDSDLLVENKDIETAENAILSLGFKRAEDWGLERIYQKGKCEIEIHDKLLYDEYVNTPAIVEFFGEYPKYIQDNQLDVSFHFLYLIAHLRKHLMNSGCGFRQFMDIAMMAKYESLLNWSFIEEKIAELNLTDFAKSCFGIIDKLFSVCVPIEHKIDEAAIDEKVNILFADGLFGFNNSENENNEALNAIEGEKKTYSKMMKRFLKQLFPSYGSVIKTDKYLFMKGKPFLMPIFWLYRIVKFVIRSDVKGIKRRLKKIFISKKEIDSKTRKLESFGINKE